MFRPIHIPDPVGTPTAVAGPDQRAPVGTPMYLDGSRSYDPEGETIFYYWTQVAGPAASFWTHPLFSDVAFAPTSAGEYRFSLVVDDGGRLSAPDTVTLDVYDLASYPTVLTASVSLSDGAESDTPIAQFTVEGTDAAGNHFSVVTLHTNTVNIDGAPGVWHLTVSAPGYVTRSLVNYMGGEGTPMRSVPVVLEREQP